jgi:hypothetical protein
MPAMEAFGRRWHIGSDDLPLPMISLMAVHVVWCVQPRSRPPLRAGVALCSPLAVPAPGPAPPLVPQTRASDPVPRLGMTLHRCLVVLASFVGTLRKQEAVGQQRPHGRTVPFSSPPAPRHSHCLCSAGASENLHACPHGFTFGVRGLTAQRCRKRDLPCNHPCLSCFLTPSQPLGPPACLLLHPSSCTCSACSACLRPPLLWRPSFTSTP